MLVWAAPDAALINLISSRRYAGPDAGTLQDPTKDLQDTDMCVMQAHDAKKVLHRLLNPPSAF